MTTDAYFEIGSHTRLKETLMYEKLLEAIQDLVDDAHTTWKSKKETLLTIAKEQGCDGQLEEFISWWDED
jgi:hypothetical protein